MKLIIILLFVFNCAKLSAYTEGGTISFEDLGDSVELYFIEDAYAVFPYDNLTTWDSVKTVWHYSYNPFNFKAGEIRDTVEHGESVMLPKYFWAAYAETVFYSDGVQILGSLSVSSNNIYLPGNHPKFDYFYPNPNNGCFDVSINTNAYRFTAIGYGGQLYMIVNLNGSTFYQLNVCPIWHYPGFYYLSFRVKFNHPLLGEWIMNTGFIVI